MKFLLSILTSLLLIATPALTLAEDPTPSPVPSPTVIPGILSPVFGTFASQPGAHIEVGNCTLDNTGNCSAPFEKPFTNSLDVGCVSSYNVKTVSILTDVALSTTDSTLYGTAQYFLCWGD